MASEELTLSDGQRKLLLLILDSFRSNQRWPTYRWLNQIAFVEYDLEFDAIYEALPRRVVLPDPARRATAIWRPEDEVSLTLRGLALLGEQADLDAFLAVVRELGSRAANFVPPQNGQAELTVGRDDMSGAIGLPVDDPSLALARELILNSLWEIWAGASGGPGDAWTISLVPERARRYRDVASLNDVLSTQGPSEAERESWAAAVATPDLLESEPEAEANERGSVETEGARGAVFVIYGRNDPARAAMFDFLTALGLEPLTWEKLLAATGEAAPYVGNVLAAGFKVAQAVVVLLTPDDEARLRPGLQHGRDPLYEKDLTLQARPNVLFEAGMALMSHPTRTVLVELGQLRPFSDVAGRHTIRMNDSVEQRRALAGRLQTAGCPVSLGGDWRYAGNFAAALEIHEPTDTAHETAQAARAQFALQAEIISVGLSAGPITLRVENRGPSDRFEATVVDIRGSASARTPWYVRWRNSHDAQREILTDHDWVLEVCEDDPLAGADSGDWAPGWRFLRPDSDVLVVPDGLGGLDHRYGGPIRVTVKVTPRAAPERALKNTLSITLSERGRAAAWDKWRTE